MNYEDVNILIPSRSPDKHVLSGRALSYCLESLRRTCHCEIRVLLNGEGTNHPQGQCAAVNRGAKKATGDWIFISNNDMYYPPGWFERFMHMVETFGLLVASPNLIEPQQGAPPFIKHFCGGLGTEGTEPNFNEQCVIDFVEEYQEHSNRPETLVENGFNLPVMIWKDVWQSVGGYDEAYDPWGSCSDTDLQTKIMLAGITPKRVRNALVYHFANTSGTFGADTEAYRHTNWRHYEKKWGFPSFKNPDVWYKPKIPMDKLTYKPDWMGKYAGS